MKTLIDWIDNRTGIRHAVNEALYENIPGGSRWRYVWGSTLVFAFMVQLITGIFLWASYSPNAKGAWESVYFIQYEMQGGWMLRGIHHFMAQMMIVLLALHFLQVVIDGAYRAPREFNFWTGLILMQIVLGLSLTGYLLPWDQKGFWATRVATNLAGLLPWIGDDVQKIVVGGTDYGHATLTRFFALHAGVLPAALIGVLFLHMVLFRRHGVTAVGADKRPAAYFWPDQVLKDAVACLAVMVVVMFFVLRGYFFAGEDHSGLPIEAHLGAELGAPADPSTPFSAARPEWYFLFLFQFLKYFPGEAEIYGAIVIPVVIMISLFLMPLVGNWKIGHGFNIALIVALLGGAGFLSFVAIQEDRANESYHLATEEAERNAIRAIQLVQAPSGIPETGAVSLMRNDPKTQGPVLFAANCNSCHAYNPVAELLPFDSLRGEGLVPPAPVSGPNLYGFGTSKWVKAFLTPNPVRMEAEIVRKDEERAGKLGPQQSNDPKEIEVVPINSFHFFGGTSHLEGEMAGYVTETMSDKDEWSDEDLAAIVAALAAQSGIESEAELGPDKIARGNELLASEDHCAMCHNYDAESDYGDAVDLNGFGSRQWLMDFISNPSAARFYGDNNDRMPAFNEDPHNEVSNRIARRDLEIIVDWLRTDWYEPQPAPAGAEYEEPSPEADVAAPTS
ncbi:cytochrome b N-terminal domain-containing protein [Bremerella cremea]|uniref:cytochrome b N-terminal domain-containing protein n=1 Tax=Bremerella cremea TaxID=1031537 RepID=UPI0031E9FB1F